MRIFCYISLAAILASALLTGCVTETTGGIPPAHANLKEAAIINTQLGAGYAREKLYPLAIQKLKLAIRERSDYARAHATLAFVYAKMGKNTDAGQQYQRALALAPNNPDTLNNYGVFLCSNGRAIQAQNYFKRAANNPNYATPEVALTNAGVCLKNIGRRRLAMKKFREALQINTNFPLALDQMAQLAYQEKKYLEAQALEQRYQDVANAGPAMLLLVMRTERALGNAKKAKEYEVLLIQKYPDSKEAGAIDGATQ